MDFSSFYTDTTDFVTYGAEHYLSVLAVVLFGVWFLYSGKYRWSEKAKWRNPIIFAAFLFAVQLFKLFFRMYLGNVDYTEDLPLQLCNMLPFLMIVGLFYKSRLLLSVIFFWILGGTFQANLTPTLENILPHYEAIRYWLIHVGLPILAIYTFYVLDYRFTIRDVVRSALGLNIIAIIIYPVNLLLDSNYLYLIAKPAPGTLFDILGPWPWYILSLEMVMMVLFSIVLIPFYIYSRINDKN